MAAVEMLRAWIARVKVSMPEFAKLVGVDMRHSFYWVSHRGYWSIPSPPLRERIERITAGAVPVRAWVDPAKVPVAELAERLGKAPVFSPKHEARRAAGT
jgi:hypothetical protein